MSAANTNDAPSVLMIGSGEYTTGYTSSTADGASKSDKRAGVVALTLFDLKRRGLLKGRILMAGTNGAKFPAIRKHVQRVIGDVYKNMDVSFEAFPQDDSVNPTAYRDGLASMNRGGLCIIFTPDDTHYSIALDCIKAGMHTLVTKPAVKTLAHHRELVDAAREAGVVCAVELHKRWDPIYTDARDRILTFGDFSYMQAYMSQPKTQLATFAAWAGRSSDISYYLNSHHIDFHAWCVRQRARPIMVTAMAANGVASCPPINIDTQDTITLTVQWQNTESGHLGVAVYTSSWIAPPSDVHSQQNFFYMGQSGEVRVDQAHRGFTASTDSTGFGSCNPLFMKYTPNANGEFAGQDGYGYKSIAHFVDAALSVTRGDAAVGDFESALATIGETLTTTAILEAGKMSLDAGSRGVTIAYDDAGGNPFSPIHLKLQ